MGFWRQTSNRFVDSQPRECQGWGQRREPVYLILPDQSQCQSTSRRDLMDQASWHPDASRTHGALARERRLRCDSQSILFRYSYRGGWHLEPGIWPLPLLFKGSRSHERCLAGCGPGAGQCQPWTSASDRGIDARLNPLLGSARTCPWLKLTPTAKVCWASAGKEGRP